MNWYHPQTGSWSPHMPRYRAPDPDAIGRGPMGARSRSIPRRSGSPIAGFGSPRHINYVPLHNYPQAISRPFGLLDAAGSNPEGVSQIPCPPLGPAGDLEPVDRPRGYQREFSFPLAICNAPIEGPWPIFLQSRWPPPRIRRLMGRPQDDSISLNFVVPCRLNLIVNLRGVSLSGER